MGAPPAAQQHAGEFLRLFCPRGWPARNLNSAEECRVPAFAQRHTINNK